MPGEPRSLSACGAAASYSFNKIFVVDSGTAAVKVCLQDKRCTLDAAPALPGQGSSRLVPSSTRDLPSGCRNSPSVLIFSPKPVLIVSFRRLRRSRIICALSKCPMCRWQWPYSKLLYSMAHYTALDLWQRYSAVGADGDHS